MCTIKVAGHSGEDFGVCQPMLCLFKSSLQLGEIRPDNKRETLIFNCAHTLIAFSFMDDIYIIASDSSWLLSNLS